MADWVLDSVNYKAKIIGGNLQGHKVCLAVCRERKANAYSACVDISPPGLDRPLVSGGTLKDASLHREFTTPKQALDAAFRSLWRHLSQNGKNTLDGLVQDSANWLPLDENGAVDWQHYDKLSDTERAEKAAQEFAYAPPTGAAVKDESRAKQLGKAYKVDAKLTALDESETAVRVGARDSGQDGLLRAQAAKKHFLGTRGLGPGLTPSNGEASRESTTPPGEEGPDSGGTVARGEPSLPVDAPSGY